MTYGNHHGFQMKICGVVQRMGSPAFSGPIESQIDGLAINSMVDLSMAMLTNNQVG